MLPGTHFFVASALSFKIAPNLFSAFILGFLSHHFLDFLPHLDLNIFNNEKYKTIKNWDLKIYFLIVTEFLFFLLLAFYFLGKVPLEKQKIAFVGGMSGLLPDIITFSLRSFFPKFSFLNFYLKFHKNFHFQLENKFFSYFLAILSQIAVILLAIFLFSSTT